MPTHQSLPQFRNSVQFSYGYGRERDSIPGWEGKSRAARQRRQALSQRASEPASGRPSLACTSTYHGIEPAACSAPSAHWITISSTSLPTSQELIKN